MFSDVIVHHLLIDVREIVVRSVSRVNIILFSMNNVSLVRKYFVSLIKTGIFN